VRLTPLPARPPQAVPPVVRGALWDYRGQEEEGEGRRGCGGRADQAVQLGTRPPPVLVLGRPIAPVACAPPPPPPFCLAETALVADAPRHLFSQVLKKVAGRQGEKMIDPNINSQFDTGRLLACISSRPGQCGRCDGYILEGKELEFYVKKMARKKK